MIRLKVIDQQWPGVPKRLEDMGRKGSQDYTKLIEEVRRSLSVTPCIPLECGFSPAQLLMSRNLRTTLPMVQEQRTPRVVNFSELEEKDHHIKERQRRSHDQRHRAKELPLLEPGDAVWILDQDTSGIVVDETAPRSHVVETSDGSYHRNRKHLVRLPVQETDWEGNELNKQNETPSPANSRETRSKTGRMARPPDRLDPSWT